MKVSKKIITLISKLLCFIFVVVCVGMIFSSSQNKNNTNLVSLADASSSLEGADRQKGESTPSTDLNFMLINDGDEYSVGAANRPTSGA